MLLRIILWSIVLTVILRFISRFLLPVLGMTQMAQKQMQDLQRQMEEMQKRQQQAQANASKPKQELDGDYIDYEDVK